MGSGVTVVAGIGIPSTSPLFLAIIAVHVVASLACVIIGAIAIFSAKGRGRHSRFGAGYFWTLAAVTGSAAILTALRPEENQEVFLLGVFCFGFAVFGRTSLRHRWRGWLRLHIIGMGLSYILLLTAFYVENGADLPLWDHLAPLAYWLIPSLIGWPVIIWAILRHPRVTGMKAPGTR